MVAITVAFNDSEGADSVITLPVAPVTGFPHSEVDDLLASTEEYPCGRSPAELKELIRGLASRNRKPRDLGKALARLPYTVFGIRPENEDYLSLSRVLFLSDSDIALLSFSISELAGALTFVRRTDAGWRLIVDPNCPEWATYG